MTKPRVYNTSTPEQAAHELLDKALVRDGKIHLPIDVVRVAEYLGIKVERLPLDDGTDGLLVKDEAYGPFKAVIDRSIHEHRARFTLAHEIGHFVKSYQDYPVERVAGKVERRDELSSAGTDPDEIWANKFAAYLLMPSFAVRKFWAQDIPVEDIAETFNVSFASLGHRLENLGLR